MHELINELLVLFFYVLQPFLAIGVFSAFEGFASDDFVLVGDAHQFL